MKLYRFSPIQSEAEFLASLKYIHEVSNKLCGLALGKHLPVAENIGYFCHYLEEYEFLTSLREQMTISDINYNQKYFQLKNEISFGKSPESPAATYKYLYVRQPDPYRAQVGDIDFVLEPKAFQELKQRIADTPDSNPFARIYPEARLDMIELSHPDIDVLAYVVNSPMTEVIIKP